MVLFWGCSGLGPGVWWIESGCSGLSLGVQGVKSEGTRGCLEVQGSSLGAQEVESRDAVGY